MLSVLVFKSPEPRSCATYWPSCHSHSPQFWPSDTIAQRHKMCIFWTPPSLQAANFCVILSTPGGEPSVGSVSEVSFNRFSVGRGVESTGAGQAERVGGSAMLVSWRWLKPTETPFNKAAVKQAWTLLGQFTAAPFSSSIRGFKPWTQHVHYDSTSRMAQQFFCVRALSESSV